MAPDESWDRLTLLLTDHQGMRPMNKSVFGRDRTTDVLSQRYDAVPGQPAGLEGEVVVNVEQAVELAGPNPIDIDRELAWYIAHGCHHLGGAEDGTPAQRAAMHRREHAWLAEARERGLLPGLILAAGEDR